MTCPVTVWNPHAEGSTLARSKRRCGEHVTTGLCVKHQADRDRLKTILGTAPLIVQFSEKSKRQMERLRTP